MEIKEPAKEFKTPEGTWNIESPRTDLAPVLDPGVGEHRVIRQFIVKSNPGVNAGGEEVLRAFLPMIKKNVIKDGWTFEREPEIHPLKDGWVVITVLRPALQRGTYIGATDATPRNASQMLAEVARKRNKKRK